LFCTEVELAYLAITPIEGNRKLGFGHVMRSLSLAYALVEAGAEVVCVGAGMSTGKSMASTFEHPEVIESHMAGDSGAARHLLRLKPDAVVVDGYHYSRKFFETLDSVNLPYAILDDEGLTAATRPLVVHNQNPHAAKSLYPEFQEKPLFLLGLS